MLEHLDDTSPPEPTTLVLGRVLERSTTLRRRRARSVAFAISLFALAVGVVIGTALPRSSSPAFTDFSSQTGVAPGTPVPLSDLENVVFVSETRGFALAVHHTQTALAQSQDGGASWHVVQGSLPIEYPTQIQFADANHGYLWGGAPASDGALPLWITDDGGATWTQASVGPVVSDVSAIGANVVAVVGGCFIGVTSPTSSCAVSTEVSQNNGETWSPTTSAPPVVESSALSISDQDVELARITTQHEYVLSYEPSDSPSQPASGRLVYSADGGRTWQTRDDPCPSYFDFGEQIAGSGTNDLWLVCASQASAGTQAKALFRSSDGGATWSLAAAANAAVLSGGVVLPAAGGLPTGGYVAPYSLGHENLAVLSPDSAWLFPDRGGMFQTSDGGRTWQSVSSLSREGFDSQGAGNVVFVNSTHGWVCESGVGLWHTRDGVTWQRFGP